MVVTGFPHQVWSLADRKRGAQDRSGAWERESIVGLGTTNESIYGRHRERDADEMKTRNGCLGFFARLRHVRWCSQRWWISVGWTSLGWAGWWRIRGGRYANNRQMQAAIKCNIKVRRIWCEMVQGPSWTLCHRGDPATCLWKALMKTMFIFNDHKNNHRLDCKILNIAAKIYCMHTK